jgi:hypothetical protein
VILRPIIKLFYKCFPFLFLTIGLNAQLHIKSGTSLHISTSTVLNIDIPSQNFIIDSGAFVINDGKIILGDSTDVSEFLNYPIIGLGTEITSRNLNQSLGGINIGGLGAVFNDDSITGITTLTRGHNYFTINGSQESIKRWFHISTTGTFPIGYSLTLYYDSTELNGNDANLARIISTNDTTQTWSSIGEIANDTLFNATATMGSDHFYSILSNGIRITSINDSIFCFSDSLEVDFAVNGLFNFNNNFVLQVSNENGSFTAPVLQDTIATDTINFNVSLPLLLTEGAGYKIRIISTNPFISSEYSGIAIYELPIINVTNLNDQYCSNDAASDIEIVPSGGVYDVNFLLNDSIYPSIASIGMNHFTYTFTSINGCSSTYTDSTDIISAPAIPLISLSNDTLFSSSLSGNQWYLDGNIILGSNDYYIIPDFNGIYEVEVTSNGCSSISDTFSFNTLEIGKQLNNEIIEIYPNPTSSDFITINTREDKNEFRIKIFDSQGKFVFSTNEISKFKNKIDITSLSSGIFFIHFFIDNEFFIKKLVIVK